MLSVMLAAATPGTLSMKGMERVTWYVHACHLDVVGLPSPDLNDSLSSYGRPERVARFTTTAMPTVS